MDTLLNDKKLADLHLHLGSASNPHFLWELAHEQGIHLPEKNYWSFIKKITIANTIKSNKYLRRIDIPEKEQAQHWVINHYIQSSPYAVEKCVHNAISATYRHTNATTIEIRFNPMFRNKSGEHDLDKIILAAIVGMKKAELEYPIKAGLILETDRQLTVKQHNIIAKKAVAFKHMGVVGIDMSGPSPKNFSIKSWVEASKIAKSGGIGVTIHTGEFTSTKEMWEVVNLIKPDRIGHGIKAINDKSIMKYLRDNKIVLEICPTSNVKTSIVKDWKEMKTIIRTFIKNGVLFTINSDGPVFLNTNVKKELLILLQKKILTIEEIDNIINLSHKSSFIKK